MSIVHLTGWQIAQLAQFAGYDVEPSTDTAVTDFYAVLMQNENVQIDIDDGTSEIHRTVAYDGNAPEEGLLLLDERDEIPTVARAEKQAVPASNPDSNPDYDAKLAQAAGELPDHVEVTDFGKPASNPDEEQTREIELNVFRACDALLEILPTTPAALLGTGTTHSHISMIVCTFLIPKEDQKRAYQVVETALQSLGREISTLERKKPSELN